MAEKRGESREAPLKTSDSFQMASSFRLKHSYPYFLYSFHNNLSFFNYPHFYFLLLWHFLHDLKTLWFPVEISHKAFVEQ